MEKSGTDSGHHDGDIGAGNMVAGKQDESGEDHPRPLRAGRVYPNSRQLLEPERAVGRRRQALEIEGVEAVHGFGLVPPLQAPSAPVQRLLRCFVP